MRTDDELQQPVDAFHALALQTACHAVSGCEAIDAARRRIMENIDIAGRQIASSKAFIGSDCRLVVLPEYCLTGFPMGDSVETWIRKGCISESGKEFQALGRIAKDNAVYLLINAYEWEPDFPELFFQACLLFEPAGRLLLRYRRLNSMFSPTPHDVWDRFREKHDLNDLFPVARTPIGNLAAVASEEILFPEVSRCLALRGAEILLHPTSQANESAKPVKDTAARARAFENMAYVISANSAGIYGTNLPPASADGGSKIINFHGQVLARAGGGESMTANAQIDLCALRRNRRRPGMENMLSRQRLGLYVETYAMGGFYPPNTLEKGEISKKVFLDTQMATIRRLEENEII